MTVTGRPLHVNSGFASPSLKTVSASLDLVLLEVCENVCYPKAFFRIKMDALMGNRTSQPHQFSHHSVSSVVTVHRVTAAVFGTNPSATKTCYSLEGPSLHFPAICELVCVRYVWWSEQSKNQCGMYECVLDGGKTFCFGLVFITEV